METILFFKRSTSIYIIFIKIRFERSKFILKPIARFRWIKSLKNIFWDLNFKYFLRLNMCSVCNAVFSRWSCCFTRYCYISCAMLVEGACRLIMSFAFISIRFKTIKLTLKKVLFTPQTKIKLKNMFLLKYLKGYKKWKLTKSIWTIRYIFLLSKMKHFISSIS